MEEQSHQNGDDEESGGGCSSTTTSTSSNNCRMMNGAKKKVAMADLKKSLDQLDRHLDKALMFSDGRQRNYQNIHRNKSGAAAAAANGMVGRRREEWEIDPRKLVVKQLIGRGTYAAVHLGTYDGQDVAVKILEYWGEEDNNEEVVVERRSGLGERKRAQLMARLRQEASLWHQLRHPNVCQFVGAVILNTSDTNNPVSRQAGGSSNQELVCCVVARYHSAGTLKSYLEKHRRKKLRLRKVVKLSLQLGRGLAYLHSRKLIHRDIKPENVVLDADNKELKIIDFGVARAEPKNTGEMGGQIGTIGYMAPEVFASKPYDSKCDVYSFGICLWEIYCCEAPFAHLGFSHQTSPVVYKSVRPEIPGNCPEALAAIMKQCWEEEPAKRPAMEDAVSMLEAIVDLLNLAKTENSPLSFLPARCSCLRSHFNCNNT
ncbi:unnamed protein product [Linum trigynum]|uniref:Protein kinase domain-containing protein n=1 Tax=Linum trigynum TaxID=586398 RepID=A0AAV2CMW8_9ROSI